jgi:hypothetical protein
MAKKQYVYSTNGEINDQIFGTIKQIEEDIRDSMDDGNLIDVYELVKVKSGEVVLEEKVVWTKE